MVAVRVPAAGIVDDDVGHARLDQPPRRQAFLPERVAAVAVPQFRLLLGEIEHVLALAQDQLVGLLLGRLGGGHLRAVGHGVAQRVQLVEQVAAGLLPLVGDAAGDDAFHLEAGGVGVAAGGEGLVRGPRNPSSENRPCGCVSTT